MDSYLITDEVCVYYFTLLKRLLILENSRTGLAKMECRGGLEFSFVMSRKMSVATDRLGGMGVDLWFAELCSR